MNLRESLYIITDLYKQTDFLVRIGCLDRLLGQQFMSLLTLLATLLLIERMTI